ncbi:MAG: T9SS type A sorting domain-containing protein [bacterium]|nr:T9SS type A sorting domain-containing protein [bacterium]
MKRQSLIWLLLIPMLSALPVNAQIQMTNSVVGSGWGGGSGSNNSLIGTVGQAAIGIATGPDWYHEVGFWTSSFTLTGVEEHDVPPAAYWLGQNHPNPFNPTTTIRYAVPEAGHVRMQLYDIRGRQVRTLMSRDHEPGYFEFRLDANDLASGIYFYSIEAGTYAATKKLLLLK